MTSMPFWNLCLRYSTSKSGILQNAGTAPVLRQYPGDHEEEREYAVRLAGGAGFEPRLAESGSDAMI